MPFETIWGQRYCKYWLFNSRLFISHCRFSWNVITASYSDNALQFLLISIQHLSCNMVQYDSQQRGNKGTETEKKNKGERASLRRTWCSEALFWESGVTSSLPLLSLCFKSAPMEQRRVSTMLYGPPPQPCSPIPPLLLHKKTQQWWKASTDTLSRATRALDRL